MAPICLDTNEIPDELFHQAKTQAALRGLEFEDLVAQGLRRELGTVPGQAEQPAGSLHDLMQEYCGIVDSCIDDLASNPKHLEAGQCQILPLIPSSSLK